MYMNNLSNGQKIPALGFGTWEIPSHDAQAIVSQALDSGYRLIDTAKIYDNEAEVGAAIAASGLPREDIFLTTKLWNDDQGYDSTRKAFDESIKKLSVDYLDLYLIHWPATSRRKESWRAMNDMYKEGLIKAIGVSNFSVRHLEELIASNIAVPMVNQVEFHPFIYEQQRELLNYCYDQNILVEAYSPLSRAAKQSHPVVQDIASHASRTPAQILLRWCIQHGTLPLPRSSNAAHIRENFNIFDFELSPDDMHKLNGLSDGERVTWDPEEMK